VREQGAVRHARGDSRSMRGGISRAAGVASDRAGASRASMGLAVLRASRAKEDAAVGYDA